ncbi:hypothetical protein PQX77_016428 [Marasmius sp. AFHP31]|nr:hypothetical protein PQX77_016428 [Marasmius sp. AFHP31]
MEQLRCSDCNFDIESSRATIQGPPNYLYRYHLRHNGYPSFDEVNPLAAEMREAQAQASLLGDTIARMEATVAALEAERGRVIGIVAQYRVILRPIHTLPPELLVRIFLLSIDPPMVLDSAIARVYPPHSLDTSKTPWTLGQVCGSWRRLAHQTSGLWSSVSFSFRDGDRNALTSQSYVHRLGLQLQHSAKYPLTVVTSTSPNATLSVADPVVVLLSFNTDHVKHLRIDWNGHNGPVTSFSRGRFQLLETLDIRVLAPPNAGERVLLDCFELASRLNKLILSGDLTGLSLTVPAFRITSLYWCDDENPTNSSLLPVRNLLAAFYNLQVCRLSLHPRTIFSYAPGSIPTVKLSSLSELVLLCTNQEKTIQNSKGILKWITAPSLTHLTLFSSRTDSASLSSLLSAPQKIVSLCIHQVKMMTGHFRDILVKLTSLQTLSFGVAGKITDEHISLFQLMVTDSKSFKVAPRLQKLVLLTTPGTKSSYSDKKLAAMLEARRTLDGVEKPHLVSVLLDRRISDRSVRTRLNILIKNGLNVLEGGERGVRYTWSTY